MPSNSELKRTPGKKMPAYQVKVNAESWSAGQDRAQSEGTTLAAEIRAFVDRYGAGGCSSRTCPAPGEPRG